MRRTGAFHIFFLVLAVVMATGGAIWAAEAEETGSFRKTWDFVWLFINFFILLIVLVKYGRKPLTDFLSRYGSEIGEKLENTKSLLAGAEEEYRKNEEKLAELDKKIEELEELTSVQARLARERILEEAEENSRLIISRARDSAETEIRKAGAAVKAELVEMALDEAEKKIKEQLQPEDDEQIIDEYVNSISQRDES